MGGNTLSLLLYFIVWCACCKEEEVFSLPLKKQTDAIVSFAKFLTNDLTALENTVTDVGLLPMISRGHIE